MKFQKARVVSGWLPPLEEVGRRPIKSPDIVGTLLQFKFRLYFFFLAAFFLVAFFFAFFLVAILLNLMFSTNGLTLVKIIIILHNANFFQLMQMDNSSEIFFYASTGVTETNVLSFLPFLNSTTPSINANKV